MSRPVQFRAVAAKAYGYLRVADNEYRPALLAFLRYLVAGVGISCADSAGGRSNFNAFINTFSQCVASFKPEDVGMKTNHLQQLGFQTFVIATVFWVGTTDLYAQSLNDIFRSRDCVRRPTLFQWSYGTSFSGGPPIDDDLATDRPDFVEASSCVGKRVLQIESGYTYFFNNDAGVQAIQHTYPEALFRYGVFTDWIELRLGCNFSHLQDSGVRQSGMDDLYVGVKIGLTPQEGILPEMAIVPQMLVPIGADELTNDRVLPGVNWLYGWDVTETTSFGASTQFNQAIDEGTGSIFTRWAQAGTYNFMFSEKLGGYTELFGLFPTSADTEIPEYYFDGGFFYRFTPDVQWDIRGGVGLNDAANDYFVGSGLSMRFR